jgi:hypothetical protein
MTMMSGSIQAMLASMAILVLPALVICLGIAGMAYRRRDKFAGKAKDPRVRPHRSLRSQRTETPGP